METTACKRCTICHKDNNQENMLICDGCDEGSHMSCHIPPILVKLDPGEWVCKRCVPELSSWVSEQRDHNQNYEHSEHYDHSKHHTSSTCSKSSTCFVNDTPSPILSKTLSQPFSQNSSPMPRGNVLQNAESSSSATPYPVESDHNKGLPHHAESQPAYPIDSDVNKRLLQHVESLSDLTANPANFDNKGLPHHAESICTPNPTDSDDNKKLIQHAKSLPKLTPNLTDSDDYKGTHLSESLSACTPYPGDFDDKNLLGHEKFLSDLIPNPTKSDDNKELIHHPESLSTSKPYPVDSDVNKELLKQGECPSASTSNLDDFDDNKMLLRVSRIYPADSDSQGLLRHAESLSAPANSGDKNGGLQNDGTSRYLVYKKPNGYQESRPAKLRILNPDVSKWSHREVEDYFIETGFANHATKFRDEGIDGAALLLLELPLLTKQMSIPLKDALQIHDRIFNLQDRAHKLIHVRLRNAAHLYET